MSNSLVFLIANEWGLKFMLDLFSLWKPYSWLGLSIRAQIGCFAFFPTVKICESQGWARSMRGKNQHKVRCKVYISICFTAILFLRVPFRLLRGRRYWGRTSSPQRPPRDLWSQLRKGVSAFEWAKCSLIMYCSFTTHLTARKNSFSYGQ